MRCENVNNVATWVDDRSSCVARFPSSDVAFVGQLVPSDECDVVELGSLQRPSVERAHRPADREEEGDFHRGAARRVDGERSRRGGDAALRGGGGDRRLRAGPPEADAAGPAETL